MTFTCFSYQLPFANPLKTSNHSYTERQGFILVCRHEEFEFYGEVAPLPGFSKESFHEVRKTLLKQKNNIKTIFDDNNPVDKLKEFYMEESISSSLQFGLDALAYQIEAQHTDQSLIKYIFPEFSEKIPVNALISLGDTDILSQIQDKKEKGYMTFKCKVGVQFDRELEQLKRIRSHFPDITIRVDANQAWSLDQAISYCNQLSTIDIEYCEEPLADNTPEHCETLSQNTSLPIAIDESVAKHSYWPNLLPYTNYLILKPMVIGSFHKCFETKRFANTHNNKVVVTTSLESSVGCYFSGILAAGIGSSQTAHGLATHHLLTDDVLTDDSFVSNGYVIAMNCKLGTIDFSKQQIFTKIF